MADAAVPVPTVEPTKETYAQFQAAYAHFNEALFDGALPNCLITLQRNKSSYGYFSGNRFGRCDGSVTDEIALNPRYFHARPIKEVLSTLVHEMGHLWQHHCGKPGRGGYHNREWAQRMKAIGLPPSSAGEEGGLETGDRVSHHILQDGPFALAAQALLATGFAISWAEKAKEDGQASVEGPNPSGPKSGKRIKYSCPSCQLNAWAKHDARLVCGSDMSVMEPAQQK